MHRNNISSTQILNQSGNYSVYAHENKGQLECPNTNIQVIIRIRNIQLTESLRNSANPIVVENNQIRIQYTNEIKSQTYSFDKVATEDKDQSYLFQEVGYPLVNYCLSGFNACIFAYGQTGAGKTYTMTGSPNDPGIQPRVLENMFAQLNHRIEIQELKSYKICVSYYEIYNEQINDLINNRKDIKIRENLDGPFIENLTQVNVSSYQDAQQVFHNSAKNRSIAATLMNKQSSRSHSIFTVYISMVDISLTEISSKLNFVDMAGSERQKKTQTEGQRLKEAGSINKSLFEFSKLIGDLARQKTNVVFRNSKLTHILKDCLVGNSKTFIICAVNPSYNHLDETENTLKFASNAKFIETKPFANQVAKVNVEELQKQLKDQETIIEQNARQMQDKDDLLQQLKIHSESQDEEINQLRIYYCKEIQDIEAEKLAQLNTMQNNQIKLSEHKGIIDNQEIEIKELKEKIRKFLEEKKNQQYEQEQKNLQSKQHFEVEQQQQQIQQECVSENSTEDEKTPTPGDNNFTDFNERIMQLEVEVSILRNQNIYNKSVQKELELINSQLSSQNKEMHMTSSILLREKESLLQEMNRINESNGQKSQMLTSEMESYKEQVKSCRQKLESSLKEIRQQNKYIQKLKEENNGLLEKIQFYEKDLFANDIINLTDDNEEQLDQDKQKKLSLYLKQIHTLTSELKKKSDQDKIFEQEKQKIVREKQLIIQKQQKIQEISESILSELKSDSNCSIEEISSSQFNCNLRDLLQKKCHELNSINTQVIQEIEGMKQQNVQLRKIIQNKENELISNKQLFLERNQKYKKCRQIQEQLEIFFIENPDFYINKKKLECFETFINFVFNSMNHLQSNNHSNNNNNNNNNTNNSMNNYNSKQDLQSNITRIKEFIDTANTDMLMYSFKELIDNEKNTLSRRYLTLKSLFIQIAQMKNESNITPFDEQKYSEYIDNYADTNQIQQIRALIFDEYNIINLRKSKRSPCKIIAKNTLTDKSLNYLNMMQSYPIKNIQFDEEATNYENFAVGKKKVKPNDY